jgi:hypothetical protein
MVRDRNQGDTQEDKPYRGIETGAVASGNPTSD